jgi:hypothetical protein
LIIRVSAAAYCTLPQRHDLLQHTTLAGLSSWFGVHGVGGRVCEWKRLLSPAGAGCKYLAIQHRYITYLALRYGVQTGIRTSKPKVEVA